MKRRNILTLIILLAIGFAAVTTTLIINGSLNLAANTKDFDVYFSKAIEDGVENKKLIKDDTHISFTQDMSLKGETYILDYDVTNGSRSYDADIKINCTESNEYLSIINEFDEDIVLQSAETRRGTLTVEVINPYAGTEEEPTKDIEIICEIVASAVERTSLGEEVQKKKEIYGIKRNVNTESTKWERIEDSVDLVANATHDGSEVQNDFDDIYPWSDIITYNYDDVTKTETAYYGDENFKFDGSNGQVLTRIPEFYYKREQRDGVEYQYISKYPQEGFLKSEAFNIGRYTMSGDSTKVYSRSGIKPLVSTTITDFRNYARKLGSDFGQLDYRYFIIQMLYLVEYADYNIQSILGQGYTNALNTSPIASGGCDQLGMKSGSVANDGHHSVIYRGIEDIFGNVWQFVDGINIKDRVAYINYNPSTYAVDTFNGDYQAVGYTNASKNGYVTRLGYDSNHSLISFPTSVGGNGSSYISDHYYQNIGNRTALVGGAWNHTLEAGLWYWSMNDISTYLGYSCGARLLKYD